MRDAERAARHVAYELGMVREAFRRMEHNQEVDRVTLESYLTHVRNLVEFFWDGAPKGAVLPQDFGGLRARDKNSAMKDLRNDISQLVSHLTWARVENHEARSLDWSLERLRNISEQIRGKASAFFKDIGEERQPWFSHDWFPGEYREWIDKDSNHGNDEDI